MAGWEEVLSSDPQVCGGEVCVSGTRIPVAVILDRLAEGSTKEDILNSYPSLLPGHIDAALAYAADVEREQVAKPRSSLTLLPVW